MAQITTAAMAASPRERDLWLIESLGRGAGAFLGRISPSGTRSFYFRYATPDRQQVRLKIGSYDPRGSGGYTVARARQVAIEWSSLYQGDPARGQAPIRDLRAHFAATEQAAEAEKEAAKLAKQRADLERQRQLTLRQLFDRWAATDLSPRVGTDGRRVGRKDGGAYTRAQFERHVFPNLGSVLVTDITRADLLALLDVQKAAGKLRTANVLLSDLKQMLRFAVHREIVDRNVLDTVDKRVVGGKDTERNRVLSSDELRRLPACLSAAGLGPRSECAIWLILGTACRVGELMSARWDQVNLKQRTWFIPAENSKNQREHLVHLSAFSARHFALLWSLREHDENSQLRPWVFPNRSGTDAIGVKGFGKQLSDRQRADPKQRLAGRSKHTDSLSLPGGRWTAHDLRRTAATTMASLGVSSDVIDECLNHMIESRVARTYIRDRRQKEQAMAFDKLGSYLDSKVLAPQFAPSKRTKPNRRSSQ